MGAADQNDIDEHIRNWRAWDRQKRAWDWLSENLRWARAARLSDDDLLAALDSATSLDDLSSVLTVVSDRLRTNADITPSVTDIVAQLVVEHPGPGRPAVAVDRVIQRLLHRLPDPPARPIAGICLVSSRRHRKAAAWRFYSMHGLDDEARPVIVADFESEVHPEFRKLVAGDVTIVTRIGVDRVVAAAPDRYWRARAIQAILGADSELEARVRATHPAEWLWAVALGQHLPSLPAVLAMLYDARSDVDIVNRVLLCLTALGDRDAIDQAIDVADAVLATPRPAPPSLPD